MISGNICWVFGIVGFVLCILSSTRADPIVFDECFINPCLHGSTCLPNLNSSYTCICAPGYTGTNCDTNINDCNPYPCLDGKNCTDGVNSYTCTCLKDCGTDLSLYIDECHPNPCVSGTTCSIVASPSENSTESSYTCTRNSVLEIEINKDLDECLSNPCANGGSCIGGINFCLCKAGFTGTRCETDVDECCPPGRCGDCYICTNIFGGFRCNS